MTTLTDVKNRVDSLNSLLIKVGRLSAEETVDLLSCDEGAWATAQMFSCWRIKLHEIDEIRARAHSAQAVAAIEVLLRK